MVEPSFNPVAQPVPTHHTTLPLDWMVTGDIVEFSVDWGGEVGVGEKPSALGTHLKE